MKNSLFNGMRIMMMQVLPATETYMMMRENIKAHNYVAIIASVSIRSMVYAYMDTLLLHAIKRSYSKHFKRIFQSNTKGFNEAEASHPHLIILFP